MRIVVMGTGPFAVPTFRWLLQSEHEVPALVTRPPRPVHRHGKPAVCPMREVAAEFELPIFDPEDCNDAAAVDEMARLQPELLMVCDYGQILSPQALGVAPRGGINLHGSLLPKYRGAAPINWAMYHGEPETGVSVIHMTPRLDGGPVLTVRRTPIGPEENAIDLEERMSQLGVEAVAEAIELLAAHPVDAELGQLQDKSQVTRAPRLKKRDAQVDWSRSAVQIHNQLRAFQPWPGCHTHWLPEGKKPVRLILSQVAPVESSTQAAQTQATQSPGRVVEIGKSQVLIATGDGLLSLEKVQPAGKRVMAIGDWLRGHQLTVGDRFGNE